uniref:Uncharacterized protein n=1 Tax=Arundo donax TaxID=35708 RepID=A0A0A9DF22_ARUDO
MGRTPRRRRRRPSPAASSPRRASPSACWLPWRVSARIKRNSRSRCRWV